MEFAWNPRKAAHNLAKHGVSFTEASAIFYDPLSLTFDDPDHSADEDRFITIGMSDRHRLLIVAHTVQVNPTGQDDTIRIISARLTTAHERKMYESGQ